MNKIKNILQSIRIEEYLLLIFSIFLFFFYFVLNPQLIWWTFFKNSFENIALGARYFLLSFIFIFFYILFKIYLYLIKCMSPFVEKKNSFKNTIFSLPKQFSNSWPKLKKFLVNVLFFIRPFLGVTVFFTLINSLLGLLAVYLQERLVDTLFAKMDESIFGFYPFFALSNQDVFSGKIPYLFIYSFLGLGIAMGIAWIVFYASGQKAFFSRYIMATVSAVMISLPLWFCFPANSPQNAYLNNVYNKEIDISLSGITKNYNPGECIMDFHEGSGVEQGKTAPISTMPSMHVAWAIIIVYYFFKFKKRTIFLTLPWFFFSTFGTFYLAQHYFIDILVALPVAFISIWLAGILIKLEKKYYSLNRMDIQESKFKSQIRKDLVKIPQAIKFLINSIKGRH